MADRLQPIDPAVAVQRIHDELKVAGLATGMLVTDRYAWSAAERIFGLWIDLALGHNEGQPREGA